MPNTCSPRGEFPLTPSWAHVSLRAAIGLLLALSAAPTVFAKRSPPAEVAAVTVDGVRYVVPHFGALHGQVQNGGYVQASDASTGRLLWDRMVYRVTYDPALERDVQDVFITSLAVRGRVLSIANELGETFEMDTATGTCNAVTKGSARTEIACPSGPPAAGHASVPPDIGQAIAGIETRLEDALAKRDRTALEPLIAATFTWVHGSDGRVESRDGWLANAAQGMALSGQRMTRSEHGAEVLVYGAGPQGPHTAVRVARIRLLDPAGTRESWMRQTHTFVREADGAWRLALGQGVVMYEGPPLDVALHARYAGDYVIASGQAPGLVGQALSLTWQDGALLVTWPNRAKGQIFLASPTEEASRTTGAGRLRFTVGPDGQPVAAALVRGEREIWRAPRRVP